MKIIPYKLPPLEDESPTSWILRLARKYHCDVLTFLEYYECSDLLKSALDIDADLSRLNKFLPSGYNLPKVISDRIIHFQWTKGRSQWLDPDNRKASAALNSITAVCPHCLNKKQYYQLKWKVSIFSCCTECECLLIQQCPKCKKRISLHGHFKLWEPIFTSKYYLQCSRCGYRISEVKSEKIDENELNQQRKVNKAYLEEPSNWEYLYFIYMKKINEKWIK